jgi:multidrug efflux pump subunit AcrB
LLGLIPLFFYSGYASGMVRELSITVFSGIAGSVIISFLILPVFISKWPTLTRSFNVFG